MPHRNRESAPGNTRPTPPPTRPLPFDDSDSAPDRGVSVPREVAPVAPAAGEQSTPGRVSRFARVFGALGGSRSSTQRSGGQVDAGTGSGGRPGSTRKSAAPQRDGSRDFAEPRRTPPTPVPGAAPTARGVGTGADSGVPEWRTGARGAWTGDSADRADFRRGTGSGPGTGKTDRPAAGATPHSPADFGTGSRPGPSDATVRNRWTPGDAGIARPPRPGEKIDGDPHRPATESGGSAGPVGASNAAESGHSSGTAGRLSPGANAAARAGRDAFRPGGDRDSGARPSRGGAADPADSPNRPGRHPVAQPHEYGSEYREQDEFADTKEYRAEDLDAEYDTDGRRLPRKLTVTRVAAMRGRELTEKGIATFRRAAEADGADKSGLTALTYATMANFALDAAIAVALANTLFFASATAESKSKVALYLLITIAPFAIIAPLIGPALDRLQTGRRLALAASFAARAVVAVVLIFSFDSWVLYPLALCMMVLSKSFAVLKSAVTPRVLPPDIDLVRTNSRLTVFGLVGGTLGAGGIAGATAALTGSTGALILATGIAVGGAYLSWKIPRWVEITEGEVPTTLSYHGDDPETEVLEPGRESAIPPRKRRQPLGRAVVTGLWGNGSIRVLTGFLTFYIAFVAKATEHRPVQQAAMLGLVGAAAAVGNFAGNATGARLRLGRPSLIVVNCTLACTAVAAVALILDNLLGAALAALVAAGASALAKVSLDASIQDDLPPESIASGFGRSETVLQLSWVVGGAGGVLLPTDYWKGFAVVSAVLAAGLVQTVLSSRGHSLLPGFGGRRPLHAEQEIPHHDHPRGDTAR